MKIFRGLVVLVPLMATACAEERSSDAGADAAQSADVGEGVDGGERVDGGTDSDTGLSDTGPGAVDAFVASPLDAPGLDAPPPEEGTRCETTPECPPGEGCLGLDDDGIGRCRDLTPIPGEGESCGSDPECSAGLVCTQTNPGGVCVPAWMLGTFEGEGLVIPDEDPSGATTGVSVGGLGTVSTEVVLRFQLRHGRSADVRVYLSNPSGTEALAWDGNAPGEPVAPVRDIERIVSGFPGDESANGRWTLRVADLDPAETGTLTSWSITLRSRFD
jgi:subtilisin-like proprotein convertase family protein